MSMTTCLFAFYMVTNNALDAFKSNAAAQIEDKRYYSVITPGAVMFGLFFIIMLIAITLYWRTLKNQPTAPQDAPPQDTPENTTVTTKRSKTKQIKDENLDIEDSANSSPPTKISKRTTASNTTAATATAAVATVSTANKTKPSPPPSPEKVRRAGAKTLTSSAPAAESPAAQTHDCFESNHKNSNSNNGNGNSNSGDNDNSINNNNSNNNDDEEDCSNEDDDENNSNTGSGVHKQHQPHKRGRRSTAVASFKTVKTAAPAVPSSTSCKTTSVPTAVTIMTDIKQLPKGRAATTRADTKLQTPLIDVDSQLTSDLNNKITIKVFPEKKTTTTGKKTTADLLQQQNVVADGGGRNKSENNGQTAVVTKQPQNKENVEPQIVQDQENEEDNDKAKGGNNAEEFDPLIQAPKKRGCKKNRKRKKNKQQVSDVGDVQDVATVNGRGTDAVIADSPQPQSAPARKGQPTEKLKLLSAAAVTGGDEATESVETQTSPQSPPVRQHTVSKERISLSNLTDQEIWYFMNKYLIKPNDLYDYGIPIRHPTLPGHAIFYRMPMRMRQIKLNPVAKEFSLAEQWTSASASPPQQHRTSSDDDEQQQQQSSFRDPVSCVRCSSFFSVNDELRFAEPGRCIYHYGKLLYDRNTNVTKYECCNGLPTSQGCTKADCHVWNGFKEGNNGPVPGFVKTSDVQDDAAWCSSSSSSSSSSTSSSSGMLQRVYGIDCEMCYTERGLEATKVTLVDLNGAVVYDSLIQPSRPIVDYNTRFSGITEELFKSQRSKTLAKVQRDLLRYIRYDTILVGHGLGSDLLALRMIHHFVVDTSVLFPPSDMPIIINSNNNNNTNNNPQFKRPLKKIAFMLLGRNIQDDVHGHDSEEDARAAVDVTLRKLHVDYHGGNFKDMIAWLNKHKQDVLLYQQHCQNQLGYYGGRSPGADDDDDDDHYGNIGGRNSSRTIASASCCGSNANKMMHNASATARA